MRPSSSPWLIIGTPCESSSVARKLRTCRSRRSLIAGSSVGPSTPQFQLRLLFSPSRFSSPFASLCFLLIDELEMRGAIAGDEVGQAAGLKMIRSVMIKGIEALTLECFLAAKRAGIVDEVAASLKNNYPTLDWNKVIEYNIERMASHGVRRADEMDQVAETLRELGIDPLMASATSTRQREMGQIGKEPAVRKTLKEGRAAMLDAISAAAKDRH